jgi:hypothetical protein
MGSGERIVDPELHVDEEERERRRRQRRTGRTDRGYPVHKGHVHRDHIVRCVRGGFGVGGERGGVEEEEVGEGELVGLAGERG